MRLVVELAVLFLAIGGCEGPIAYRGTSAFDSRASALPISPTQALDLARQFGDDTGAIGELPIALVGHWYLFNRPHKMAVLHLDGVYVDGDTGRVEHRHSDKRLYGSFLSSFLSYPNGMPVDLPVDGFTGVVPLRP